MAASDTDVITWLELGIAVLVPLGGIVGQMPVAASDSRGLLGLFQPSSKTAKSLPRLMAIIPTSPIGYSQAGGFLMCVVHFEGNGPVEADGRQWRVEDDDGFKADE